MGKKDDEALPVKKSKKKKPEKRRNMRVDTTGMVAVDVPGEKIRRLVPQEIDPRTGRKKGTKHTHVKGKPASEMSKSPKQIRARARRRGFMTTEELEIVYKPLDQWDAEELAAGRPKGKDGKFYGPKPTWVTREMHEEAVKRFHTVVKTEMNMVTVPMIKVLQNIVEDDTADARGRPIVPASVKVDIAKFLLEHTVGKPTQRVEQDISVRLQGILAQVMVNPTPGREDGSAGYGREVPGLPGFVKSAVSEDAIVVDVEDDEDLN